MSVAATQGVRQEKVAQTRLWALPLAFAIAGVRRRPSRTQFRLVGEWILPDISWQALSWWTRYRFHRTLRSLSRTTKQIPHRRLRRLCANINRIAPMAQRYPIMALCLALCRTNKRLFREETDLLWRFSEWLELDPQRVRSMVEKTLPIHQHEISDLPSLIGLSSTLSVEAALRQLNREYAKWNARVTHADRSIQRQAAQMLDLIARERGRYVS